MPETGFGIIGCGMIAKYHAHAVKQIENTLLCGFADAVPEAAARAAAEHGGSAYPSVEALLADDAVEIVSVCVPNGLHAALAVRAMEAGKHVVLEKPMCISLAECDAILNACERTGRRLAVISQFRFDPLVRAFKAATDRGALGRPVIGNVTTNFYRTPEYYKQAAWRGTWALEGGGALINQGIHGLDVVLYLLGGIKSVTAHARTLVHKIEVEDTLSALVEYECGAVGMIQAATTAFPGYPRRIEILGDAGGMVAEGETVVRWNVPGMELPGDVKTAPAEHTPRARPEDGMDLHGHVLQLRDMIGAVHEQRDPVVSQHDGARAIRAIMAIYESSKTGRTVDLKTFGK